MSKRGYFMGWNYKKNLLLVLALFLLTACGKTTDSAKVIVSETTQQKAMNKIVNYATSGAVAPTITDYLSAGIHGISVDNIDKINAEVAKFRAKDVDTKEEIQAIADRLNVVIVNPSDTVKPVITLLGNNPVTLNTYDTYTEFGATASDDVDGNISSSIVVNATALDMMHEGNYTIIYSVRDAAGNEANTSRIVSVENIPVAKNTHVNEVLASNAYTNLDPDVSKFSDWIELYNGENHMVDVGGFYLSDKEAEPTKWQIPTNTRIPAHGYLLIWADEKEGTKAIHADFKLSAKGEAVIFSDRGGNEIDKIVFPKQTADISCALDGNNSIVYMTPTPAAENATIHVTQNRSDEPLLSVTAPVTITATGASTIYYTTDGSMPTTHSSRYSGAINISETKVIRASALENGKFLSKPVSKTYFSTTHTSTLPIVSLATDEKYLFDSSIGIHTNYEKEWKRPVHIEYFDKDHSEKFATSLEFAISGQSSRAHPKKSFEFEFDKDYGMKSLESTSYQLYLSKNLAKIKDFKIRSGNHGYGIGDLLAGVIVKDGNLSVDYQAYRTVEMFMNGEYWGVYNIREKKGVDYLVSNYPALNEDKLDLINNNGSFAKHGDYTDYAILRDLARDYTHYNEVLALIDETSFIDYMCVMIYSGNRDWIWANSRAWKEDIVSPKWRWMLDDVDEGFDKNAINNNNFTMLQLPTHRSALANTFITLMKNATFKAKFDARFTALLDTLFSSATMQTRIDKIIDERKDEITKGRWGISQSTFDDYVSGLRDFATQRAAIVKTQLEAFIP